MPLMAGRNRRLRAREKSSWTNLTKIKAVTLIKCPRMHQGCRSLRALRGLTGWKKGFNRDLIMSSTHFQKRPGNTEKEDPLYKISVLSRLIRIWLKGTRNGSMSWGMARLKVPCSRLTSPFPKSRTACPPAYSIGRVPGSAGQLLRGVERRGKSRIRNWVGNSYLMKKERWLLVSVVRLSSQSLLAKRILFPHLNRPEASYPNDHRPFRETCTRRCRTTISIKWCRSSILLLRRVKRIMVIFKDPISTCDPRALTNRKVLL